MQHAVLVSRIPLFLRSDPNSRMDGKSNLTGAHRLPFAKQQENEQMHISGVMRFPSRTGPRRSPMEMIYKNVVKLFIIPNKTRISLREIYIRNVLLQIWLSNGVISDTTEFMGITIIFMGNPGRNQ